MNAPSVASAVKSTTFTAPISIDVPMTPQAVIRKPPPVAAASVPPLAFTRLARLVLTSCQTPMASSERYSTEVATTTTMKSTTETAKANFITDQGSIRLRFSRARRGPRAAAEVTVERADRTASVTRAAPTAAEPLAAALPAGRLGASAGRCALAPDLAVGRMPVRAAWPPWPPTAAAPPLLPLVTIGTVAEPFATDGPVGAGGPAGRLGSACPSPSGLGSPGGGAMPG